MNVDCLHNRYFLHLSIGDLKKDFLNHLPVNEV